MSFPYSMNWSPASQRPAAHPQPPGRPVAGFLPAVQAHVPAYPHHGLAPAAAQSHFFAPAPSYPASNMPAMWNRLHPYIAHSPTLARQLAQLVKMGWSVQWNPNQGASCDPQTRQITISPNLPDTAVMQFLAHETRHAFETPVDARLHASDVQYASVKMRNEAVAVLNHLRVRSEIFQGSGHDIGYSQPNQAYYENALNFSRRHGSEERLLQHIQRLMTWEVTGVHQRPYWEVYLNVWRTSRGMPPVSVPPGLSEANHAQAWHALSAEMNAG